VERIVDAQGWPNGGFLALGADGELWIAGRDGNRRLGAIDYPLLDLSQTVEMRVSPDAEFLTLVNRYGRYGCVVGAQSGRVLMSLDRGDYHEDVSAFPVAFVRHAGRTVVVHATDWNRLDASDPATGECLTAREPTSYRTGEPRPPHYLDYFHGGLTVSPGGTRIADNGWIWHPLGIVRTWSISDWLGKNVWESEDGASLRTFDFESPAWDRPLVWVDDRTLAVADGEESSYLRLLDVVSGEEVGQVNGPDASPLEAWPAGSRRTGWLAFRRWLHAISPEHGTEVWDLGTRRIVHHEPTYSPRRQTDDGLLDWTENVIEIGRFVG